MINNINPQVGETIIKLMTQNGNPVMFTNSDGLSVWVDSNNRNDLRQSETNYPKLG